MKAALQQATHQPVQIVDVDVPHPGPNQALVRIQAAALNHRDVWVQQGLYPGMKLPCILGSDGAGVVTDVGEGVRTSLVGRHVIVNPALNWGDNPKAYGKNFRVLGMPDHGTFAEYLVVEAKYLHPKPAHLDFAEAAALPLGGLTAWRALFSRGKLRSGERVLISGIGGGVALLGLQLALAAGADVWVTSGSDEKLERAKALGAMGGANYKNARWGRELAGQTGGFDLILDSAAGEGFAELVDAAAPGGRIVVYGGTKGIIPNLAPPKVFFKHLDILGSTMGTEADFADMVDFVERQQLHPVLDRTFPLAETEAALRYMEAGGQFGKIGLSV